MTTEELELLKAALWEIENLQRKVAAGEQEGWEGSKRRLDLKERIEKAIKTGKAQ